MLVPNASLLALLLLHPDLAPLAPQSWGEGGELMEGDWPGLTVEGLERTLDYVGRTIAPLSQARMARPDADLIANEFRNAAALLRHACRLGIARLRTESGEIASIPAEKRQALASELEEIVAEYRRLWLRRNRPGGLADSVGRMERLLTILNPEW